VMSVCAQTAMFTRFKRMSKLLVRRPSADAESLFRCRLKATVSKA
jgi:hypothetical protein